MLISLNLITKLNVGFKRQEKGFTLLEVVVATTILSVGLLAVASMQISSIRGNASAGDVTEAAILLGDEIEKLMRLSWDDPLLQDTDGDGTAGLDDIGFDNDSGTQSDSDRPPVTQGKYTVHCNVAENIIINDTKTIHIIVTWADHGIQKRFIARRIIPNFI
jgi:type IV pilus assembly protein PilV